MPASPRQRLLRVSPIDRGPRLRATNSVNNPAKHARGAHAPLARRGKLRAMHPG
ncbi:hypothetical protein K788_0005445 [Paraburkholderia caribensis MBA4]|uniref:Uncharacterized protein n=1 Tax=Paraburkholderia caribensis MBA4 TaxID=1323664 RepID=A0A0N7JUU5_9BURK|nr:hypothetical protein K788_0005445 [Paraburkholderia caribensis MBA4]